MSGQAWVKVQRFHVLKARVETRIGLQLYWLHLLASLDP